MPVFYRLYQNNRDGFASKGKWYVRVKENQVRTVKDIAKEIQETASRLAIQRLAFNNNAQCTVLHLSDCWATKRRQIFENQT